MATLSQLAATAASLEALDEEREGNPGEAGWWRRIALAAEGLAGASSDANPTVEGWMLRTAVALEALKEADGSAFNAGQEGMLARIVAALEGEEPGEGSLGKRLMDAAAALQVEEEE
jgi:hypothetical protein